MAKQIEGFVANGTKIVDFNVEDIEYILGTGRNWKGPIGTFALRIEKGAPDEIVSLCFSGKPNKISPTMYEFYKRPGNLLYHQGGSGTYRTVAKGIQHLQTSQLTEISPARS